MADDEGIRVKMQSEERLSGNDKTPTAGGASSDPVPTIMSTAGGESKMRGVEQSAKSLQKAKRPIGTPIWGSPPRDRPPTKRVLLRTSDALHWHPIM